MKPEVLSVEPEAISVDETCRVTGLGRSKIYELIADGTLPSVKVGKRRLVRLATARQLIAGLEHAGIGGGPRVEHANAPAVDRGAAETSLAGDGGQHSKNHPSALAAIEARP
jgi:excisionase family DNA binding protein